MTHHVKATVQGPGMTVHVISVKCDLEHGFDAMTRVILELANFFSMTAEEVMKAFTILHMSVIRV